MPPSRGRGPRDSLATRPSARPAPSRSRARVIPFAAATLILLLAPALAAPVMDHSYNGDVGREAAIRAAVAAVVDPVGAWAEHPVAGPAWGTHFNLLFGFGGEGSMSVLYEDKDRGAVNASLPHRPAAFPAFLAPKADLPVEGVLVPFVSLKLPNTSQIVDGESVERYSYSKSEDLDSLDEPPERACVPRAWPPIRPSYPSEPYIIALVERGGCDFATKVRAAQERGAAAVVVGDKRLRSGETDEEGRKRDSLITMYSPEDTSGIIIPSVFVSRASYLLLRDLLANNTVGGLPGLFVDIGPSDDDGSALGSLLLFALLMPTMFLLVTVTAHRVRVARQREANRAPPTVVLSLPERVWTPDIVWEKDSDESDKGEDTSGDTPTKPSPTDDNSGEAEDGGDGGGKPDSTDAVPKKGDTSDISATIDGAAAEPVLADDEAETTSDNRRTQPKKNRKRGKERRKSKTKRYYSKDECAICMDNFHRGEVVRILPCGHVFHKDECDEWLLKWRKLCPTCRADVTISAGDLSASTTLTPVVGPDAVAAEVPVVQHGWRETVHAGLARVEAAVLAISGSVRAVVRRPAQTPPAQAQAHLGRPDERTPLIAPGP